MSDIKTKDQTGKVVTMNRWMGTIKLDNYNMYAYYWRLNPFGIARKLSVGDEIKFDMYKSTRNVWQAKNIKLIGG